MMRRKGAEGFSLVEILVALTLLMVLVQVVGVGLATVYHADRQTGETEKAAAMARFVASVRATGLSGDSVIEAFKENFEDAPKPRFDVVEDEEGRRWETWEVTSSKSRGKSLRFSLQLPPES